MGEKGTNMMSKSLYTKQPEMLARARGPVYLKPRSTLARPQSPSETGAMPCNAHVVLAATSTKWEAGGGGGSDRYLRGTAGSVEWSK